MQRSIVDLPEPDGPAIRSPRRGRSPGRSRRARGCPRSSCGPRATRRGGLPGLTPASLISRSGPYCFDPGGGLRFRASRRLQRGKRVGVEQDCVLAVPKGLRPDREVDGRRSPGGEARPSGDRRLALFEAHVALRACPYSCQAMLSIVTGVSTPSALTTQGMGKQRSVVGDDSKRLQPDRNSLVQSVARGGVSPTLSYSARAPTGQSCMTASCTRSCSRRAPCATLVDGSALLR